VKHLQDAAADDDCVVVPGLAGFRLVSEAGRLVAPSVAKCDSMVAWRKRSSIVIEKILAWQLTAARNETHLSQGALAKAVGRPQSFVAKIELNRRHVQVIELVQLCAVMDQDPCELLMKVVQSLSVQEVLTIMENLKSSQTSPRSAVTGNEP
jgi:DNA-binding transcriptional regulator YiaG